MTRAWVLLLSVLLVAALGCGKVADQAAGGGGVGSISGVTSADANEDGAIDDVPEAVNDLFTVGELQALIDAGLPVFTGAEQPDVEGSYNAGSLRIAFDSNGASGALSLYMFYFTGQTDAATVNVAYTDELGYDVSTGNLTYIAGTGGCFSLYGLEEATDNSVDDCTYQRRTVYSGCVSATDGVVGFSFGFYMGELSGSCTDMMAAGSMRVVKETDNLATRH